MIYTDAQLDAIDRLVAEKVMGWHQDSCHLSTGTWDYEMGWVDDDDEFRFAVRGWHPTRDRGQAMEVFERCEDMVLGRWGKLYRAHEAVDDEFWDDEVNWHATADTPMMAICPAALRKVGVEVPQ